MIHEFARVSSLVLTDDSEQWWCDKYKEEAAAFPFQTKTYEELQK